MSAITFNCPSCKAYIETPSDYGGEIVECPECESDIEVPEGIDKQPVLLLAGIPEEQRHTRSKGFFSGNAWEIQDAILDRLGPDEELVSWTCGMTAPNDILASIPLLSLYHAFNKKWWLIALTKKDLYLFRHRRRAPETIIDVMVFPISKVAGMTLKSGILFSAMTVVVPPASWKFKEMEKADVKEFIAHFNGLKKKKKKKRKQRIK